MRHIVISRRLPLILITAFAACAFVAEPWQSIGWTQDRGDVPVEVLLLEHNRVMRGRITVGRETLTVNQDSSGIVTVPKAMVRYQGPDMASIYAFLLNELPQDAGADDHVRLARWCISNKMLPEARLELETALNLEPERDDIRRNLSTLNIYANRSTESAKSVKSQSPAQRQAKMLGLGGEEVESLGGLSRESGQQFTTRIQPILMHNCTNSACHGPLSENDLKFGMARLGTHALRATTEKNLLTLLKYVDRDNPRASPLWTILTTNHGAQGSSIFTGTKGSQQLETFKSWVLSLSTNPEMEEESAPPVRRKGSIVQVAGTRSSDRKTDKTLSRTANRNSKSPGAMRPSASEVDEFNSGESTARELQPIESEMGPSEELPIETSERETSERSTTVRRGGMTSGTRTRSGSNSRSRSGTPSDAQAQNQFPAVDSIITKDREPIADLPTVDPFDPEVFNRKQRLKRELDE